MAQHDACEDESVEDIEEKIRLQLVRGNDFREHIDSPEELRREIISKTMNFPHGWIFFHEWSILSLHAAQPKKLEIFALIKSLLILYGFPPNVHRAKKDFSSLVQVLDKTLTLVEPAVLPFWLQ